MNNSINFTSIFCQHLIMHYKQKYILNNMFANRNDLDSLSTVRNSASNALA